MVVHNSSLLQVVREHKNQSRESQKHHGAQANQNPVVPGHSNLPRIEFAQNLWPQIPSKLVVDWRKGLLQRVANLAVIVFSHVLVLMFFHSGLIPAWLKRLRRMRTARNTRSFTAPTDVPKALAISSYGSSSTRASVAATCNLAGSLQNACWILSLVSRCNRGSGCATPAGSVGKLCSGRLRRRWSIAKLVAIRRAQAPKLPSGRNRCRAR